MKSDRIRRYSRLQGGRGRQNEEVLQAVGGALTAPSTPQGIKRGPKTISTSLEKPSKRASSVMSI
jgi:hypothetical protein